MLDTVLAAANVHSGLPRAARGRVEHTVRQAGDEEFWFLVNLTDEPVDIDGIDGAMLVPPDGPTILGPRAVAVIRRAADQSGDGKPSTDPERPGLPPGQRLRNQCPPSRAIDHPKARAGELTTLDGRASPAGGTAQGALSPKTRRWISRR